jgi:hypothetical protein
MVALLAHQGGWDEVLLAASPIVLFALLLVIANRRQEPADGTGDMLDDDHHDSLRGVDRLEDPDGRGDTPGR